MRSLRASANLANQHRREPHRAPSPIALVARGDVTTTVYMDPTNSGSGSARIPWAALAGGLGAGIVIVVTAIVCWRCWGRKDDRIERARRKSEDQFERVEWRPEDPSRPPMKSTAHRQYHQHHPNNGPGPGYSSNPKRLPSSPPYSPQQRPVNVELRTSTVSDSSSSNKQGRYSDENRVRKSYDDKSSERSGHAGSENKVSTVPHNGASSDIASTAPASEDEKGRGSPSPRDTPTSSSPPRKSPRKDSTSEARREAPALPHSLTATGPRRYAPVRPSPLAQASYRNSSLPPSSSPASLPIPVSPRERQQYLESRTPPRNRTPIETPPPSPLGNASDPFLQPPRPQPSYQPQHRDYQYLEGEDEYERPASGVGYAI